MREREFDLFSETKCRHIESGLVHGNNMICGKEDSSCDSEEIADGWGPMRGHYKEAAFKSL